MFNRLLIYAAIVLSYSCEHREVSGIEVIRFDEKLIDSLQRSSDSVYTTLLQRQDFFAVDIYITYKDTLVTKVFKDSSGKVTAVNRSQNGVTHFAAEYYPNGQLVGKTEFSAGTIDGLATYYFPDGRIRSVGVWRNYAQVGVWKNYRENGELKEIVYFDENGKILKKDTMP